MGEHSKNKKQITRRSFLRQSAVAASAAVVGPTILTGCATTSRGERMIAPGERVNMAAIGLGWQGTTNMTRFLSRPDVQMVAICDVDQNHLAAAKRTIDNHYENTDCRTYTDFREMYAKESLDAVTIGLPDHWHAIPAIAAAEAGLDVFGEKPFAHTLVEGRAMVKALNKNGCVWQTGSWQRSVDNFHQACEIVRNGRIGRVHTVEVGLGIGHDDYMDNKDETAPRPAPPELDYDRWLGPARYEPYAPARVHKNWRWIMDYGGGKIMDWVGHHVDIAHWGLGFDETGPIRVTGTGVIPPKGELWDAPTEYDCTAEYEGDVTIRIASHFAGGTRWYGDSGWLYVDRGDLKASSKEILRDPFGGGEARLYRSRDHWGNFIDCVRSREATITPAETAHRSASVGHLCLAAIYTGRTINWNPETETIADDAEATRMLSPDYRSPWVLG